MISPCKINPILYANSEEYKSNESGYKTNKSGQVISHSGVLAPFHRKLLPNQVNCIGNSEKKILQIGNITVFHGINLRYVTKKESLYGMFAVIGILYPTLIAVE